MSNILADFSQASMARAIEANLFAFFQHLRTWPRVDVHDTDDCCWTISDFPYPLFNSVTRARISDAGADPAITARIEACRQRGVPMLWWTGPSTTPGDLGDRLLARGFLNEPAFGMAASLARSHRGAQPEPAITIEPVADRRVLDEWSAVLCTSFGAPPAFGDAFAAMAEAIGLDRESPFRHYLARVDGRPAGTCSLFLGAGVAGIYDVSTLPELRRRGIGAAVTRLAMADARAAGVRMAILHASSLGLGTYRSLGFETICDIGQYVWVPEDFKR
jgi:ribosomal protein S18 acetylase RimI-like enzyme